MLVHPHPPILPARQVVCELGGLDAIPQELFVFQMVIINRRCRQEGNGPSGTVLTPEKFKGTLPLTFFGVGGGGMVVPNFSQLFHLCKTPTTWSIQIHSEPRVFLFLSFQVSLSLYFPSLSPFAFRLPHLQFLLPSPSVQSLVKLPSKSFFKVLIKQQGTAARLIGHH